VQIPVKIVAVTPDLMMQKKERYDAITDVGWSGRKCDVHQCKRIYMVHGIYA
jgi:hypothetical protein